MLSLKAVTQFKRDFKKYKHKQNVVDELDEVIARLRSRKKLPEKYNDHSLAGEYSGLRECHVKPDVLLIYWINERTQILYLERMGSHSDLF